MTEQIKLNNTTIQLHDDVATPAEKLFMRKKHGVLVDDEIFIDCMYVQNLNKIEQVETALKTQKTYKKCDFEILRKGGNNYIIKA